MMKRLFCLLLAVCMAVSLCACGKGVERDTERGASASEPQPSPAITEPPQASADGAEVDLTVLSSTMVYAEVYNMLYNDSESYLGKTVRARGEFSIYQLVVDGVLQPDPVAYACIIADAAACCAEGMEFVLKDNLAYPDDYPEPGAEITVVGEFQAYEENGMTGYHLINARLESSEMRYT